MMIEDLIFDQFECFTRELSSIHYIAMPAKKNSTPPKKFENHAWDIMIKPTAAYSVTLPGAWVHLSFKTDVLNVTQLCCGMIVASST